MANADTQARVKPRTGAPIKMIQRSSPRDRKRSLQADSPGTLGI